MPCCPVAAPASAQLLQGADDVEVSIGQFQMLQADTALCDSGVQVMLPYYECLPEEELEGLRHDCDYDCPKVPPLGQRHSHVGASVSSGELQGGWMGSCAPVQSPERAAVVARAMMQQVCSQHVCFSD